ncbi:MAG: hypothetical protein WCI75_15255 [candidate division NC10 bacterium]
MRKRRVELMGIGHPLIDGLLAYLQSSNAQGEVTCLSAGTGNPEPKLTIRALLTIEAEAKHTHREVKIIQVNTEGQIQLLPDDWDLHLLKAGTFKPTRLPEGIDALPWNTWRQTYESAIGAILTQTRMKVENPLSARVQLLGLSLLV